MRRTALYSRSTPRDAPTPALTPAQAASTPQASVPASGAPDAAPAPAAVPTAGGDGRAIGRLARRHERWLAPFVVLLIGALAFAWWQSTRPAGRALTQKDIDSAVLHTLATQTLPSRAAKAYATIEPSVVKVVGTGYPDDGKGAKPPKDGAKRPGAKSAAPEGGKNGKRSDQPPLPEGHPDIDKGVGIGSGVVIVDNGTILTNLHVVLGASKLKVVFYDGTEADASVIGIQAENDLAVLKAAKLPDDLKPAALRSTQDLVPGDEVVAVGFPFGIGPSASAGIISGLKREYRSADGKRSLTNLIQFDAAANPGNSGGPLVTMDGEVIGIVTAIFNPTDQRVFVGIGFAVPIENAAAAAGMSPF